MLADGSRVEGDVLIAAEGVRSRIREQMFEPEAPQFSGCMAWRGITPASVAKSLGFEHDSYIWMGPERSVVIYYVSGGELINWIGIGPSYGDTRESWTTQGTTEAALRVLMADGGLPDLMKSAVAAAAARSRELAG